MDIKKLIGIRIKELRIKNKLTQEQLAELVSVTAKYQSRIETGRHYPSAELIEKYSKVFAITPVEILQIHINTNRETMMTQIMERLKKASDNEVKLVYKMLCY